MKITVKKALSLLLALVMAFSVSVPAFAAEDEFAKYLGDTVSLTEGVTSENGVFTNKDEVVLDFVSAADISDSFGTAAWRAIVKLTVSESVTDGMLAKAKYYVQDNGEWNEIGLISASESYNAQEKSFVMALDISAADLEKDEVSVAYGFDWDGNGTQETLQQVKIALDTDKLVLTHGENNINCVEYVDEVGLEPTCTQVGYTESSHCSVCGLTVQPRTEIESLGHSFTEKVVNDAHLAEKNGDGTSTYFYNCAREGCDEISTQDTYTVLESDYAVPATTVTNITENLTVNAENPANITVTNEDMLVLDFSLSNPAVGRLQDGWWAGIRITADSSIPAEQLKNVKYRTSTKDGWSQDKSFWSNKDSKNDADVHYIDCWLLVTPELIANDDDGYLSIVYDFDWDNNGFGVSTQKINFRIDVSDDKLSLVHTAGHTKVVTEEASEPDCINGGCTEGSYCSVCGLTLSEYKELAPLGHSFTEKVVNDAHLAEKNGDGTSTYFYNCAREGCDEISTQDTYTVLESDYAVPATTVTNITENLTVNAENPANITVTNEDMLVLDFSLSNPAVGRLQDGWWAGIRITADSSIPAEQLKNVKYRTSTKDGWSQDKSFWSNKDSKNDADVHYIDCWLLVTPELIANDDDGYLSIVYDFDWDNNGFGVSTQKINFRIDVSDDKLSLVHTAGHTKVVTEEGLEPTCDNPGYSESSYCSVCGLTLSKRTDLDALGHDFSEVILDEAHLAQSATCSHYDLYRYSCIRCDAMSTDTFYEDKQGSTLKEHEIMTKPDKLHLISPADCENPAKYYMGCRNCDIIFYDETFTDGSPLYHSWKIEKITKKATISTDGTINFYCDDCGKQDNSPIPIPRVASIKLAQTKTYYTGKAITPAVVIKDRNGAELRKGTDYTVKYIGSDIPGTATARITFIGKYEGTYDATYKIEIPVPAKTAFASNTNTLKISWSKVSVAAGYAVYVKNASGWRKLGTTGATSVTFRNLPSGTKYTFAVKAGVLKDGKAYFTSEYVTIDTVTTSPGPAKVVTAQNTSAIKLTWSAVKGADGYAVLLKTQSGWKTLGLTAKTTATLTGLKSGTNYIYAVRSVNLTASGQKVGGGYIQITTATQPVKPVVSATTSGGNATVRWTAVQGASGYEVYYKSATSGGFVLIDTVSAGTTTLTDSGYSSGSKYAFAVRAKKAVQGGYIYGPAGQVTVTMN